MKIAVCGLIGYERAKEILDENKEVAIRLPKFLIEQFYSYENLAGTCPGEILDGAIEIKSGGLYRNLWEICEVYSEETGKKKGCEIYFEEIPILQEVVEIMEIAGEDPYESKSKGAFVAFGESFPAGYKVIGKFTENKDRVIIFGNNKRFLTPPSRQEKDLNQIK